MISFWKSYGTKNAERSTLLGFILGHILEHSGFDGFYQCFLLFVFFSGWEQDGSTVVQLIKCLLDIHFSLFLPDPKENTCFVWNDHNTFYLVETIFFIFFDRRQGLGDNWGDKFEVRGCVMNSCFSERQYCLLGNMVHFWAGSANSQNLSCTRKRGTTDLV